MSDKLNKTESKLQEMEKMTMRKSILKTGVSDVKKDF